MAALDECPERREGWGGASDVIMVFNKQKAADFYHVLRWIGLGTTLAPDAEKYQWTLAVPKYPETMYRGPMDPGPTDLRPICQ